MDTRCLLHDASDNKANINITKDEAEQLSGTYREQEYLLLSLDSELHK